MNVLVIQPPSVAQVLKTALQNCAPVEKLRTADSWARADSLLARHRFDVAILDMDLLCEHGLGLVRRIRATHPLMMIIALEGADDLALRVALYEIDVDICLTKPVALEELMMLVSSYPLRYGLNAGLSSPLGHAESAVVLAASGH